MVVSAVLVDSSVGIAGTVQVENRVQALGLLDQQMFFAHKNLEHHYSAAEVVAVAAAESAVESVLRRLMVMVVHQTMKAGAGIASD